MVQFKKTKPLRVLKQFSYNVVIVRKNFIKRVRV